MRPTPRLVQRVLATLRPRAAMSCSVPVSIDHLACCRRIRRPRRGGLRRFWGLAPRSLTGPTRSGNARRQHESDVCGVRTSRVPVARSASPIRGIASRFCADEDGPGLGYARPGRGVSACRIHAPALGLSETAPNPARYDAAARRSLPTIARALDGSPEPVVHLTSSAGSSRRVSFRGFATA